MVVEKKNYITKQINNDYIIKSKNSSLAFLLVAILFFFLHSKVKTPLIYNYLLLSAMIILSLFRLHNVSQYETQNLAIERAVWRSSLFSLLNGMLWSALGVFSLLSYDQFTIHIFIPFLILNVFSSSSIITISHKTLLLMVVNCLFLFPQTFFAFLEYNRSGETASLWLLGYTSINIFYVYRQGRLIQNELKKRFATEYELKKSLEEVAQSKKYIEEETIKTFHASRLSSLGEMASGVAHEINNPLTIIQGMSKSLLSQESLKLDEPIRQKLTKIHSASERIAKIVKGMKIISSKNDQIEHELVNVSKILELSIGLFEERFKNEDISLVIDNPLDPIIKCNQLQISQILINLIINAIDALSKLEEEKNLQIKVMKIPVEKCIDILVINNGPLIDHQLEAKIFEPFFSTKSLGKGTGLGLSISQTLANNNGGSLSYEVYQGKVCFKLRLPNLNHT